MYTGCSLLVSLNYEIHDNKRRDVQAMQKPHPERVQLRMGFLILLIEYL